MFIFHLNILHGFKVLTPGQGREVSLSSRSTNQNIYAKCHLTSGGFEHNQRYGLISEKANLLCTTPVVLNEILFWLFH